MIWGHQSRRDGIPRGNRLGPEQWVCVGRAEGGKRGKKTSRMTTLCCLVHSVLSNGRSYHRQGPQPLSHLPTISPTLDYPWRANLHAFNHLLLSQGPISALASMSAIKSREKEREMEGVEGGGAEKLFHAPRRKCITGIAVQTLRKSTLSVY